MAPSDGRAGGRRGSGPRARAEAAPAPFAAAWPGGTRFLDAAAWRGWLRACWAHEVEQRRLFPFGAVAFGAGILLAFAADGPPAIATPLTAAVAASAAAVFARHRFGLLIAYLALAALFAGFAAALWRMQVVAAPILPRLAVERLEGFVETVEERPNGGRLVIRPLARAPATADAPRPERVRVTVRSLDGIAPGDFIRATVRLLPPPDAARPGGYDFARDAFFRGIGAVGSVSGRVVKVDPPPVTAALGLRVAAAIDAARNALTRRIATAIGGQAGAVSAALVTGKRGLIDERTNEILRAAGIYHVVSISGLHMVLAAGTFFWLTRALLALSPALALGWPIKKIAALVGMTAATAYCVFSGAEVATERSLVMILVMQGAILFDRPALTLRNLAISAVLVLLREPEALLGPSFQMSYAAVAGLIALAEWLRRRSPDDGAGHPAVRVGRWLAAAFVGTVATTVVATVATGPFGTFHFQTVQPYGLVGNAATLPLVSIAVMPAAVLGMLMLPFGLDRPVWSLMGIATEGVLRLSEWVAGFPGSTLVVPAFGTGALACLALALLLATLLASGLRGLATVPAALGVALALNPVRPDVFVARDGAGAAVRGADGRLAILGRVPAFTVEQWLKADGDGRRPADPGLRAGARCDRIGCTALLADGRAVSVLFDRRGFETDCRRATIVIARAVAPGDCAAAHVFDGRFLDGHGAATLSRSGEGFAVRTVREPGDTRPWLVRSGAGPPRPARDRPAAREPRPPDPPDDPARADEVDRPPDPGEADGDEP